MVVSCLASVCCAQVIIDSNVLPCLLALLTNSYNKTNYEHLIIKGWACWIISFITEGSDEQIQASRAPKAVATFSACSPSCSLRDVMAESSKHLVVLCAVSWSWHWQSVVDAGIIPHLVRLLATKNIPIKQAAAWAISNATQGTQNQIK